MFKKIIINSAIGFISKLISDKVKDEPLKVLLGMLLLTTEKVVSALTDGNKADNKDQIKEIIKKDLEVLAEAVAKVI